MKGGVFSAADAMGGDDRLTTKIAADDAPDNVGDANHESIALKTSTYHPSACSVAEPNRAYQHGTGDAGGCGTAFAYFITGDPMARYRLNSAAS